MFSSVRWPLALAFFLLTVICVSATELVVFQAVRQTYLETVEENLNRDCTLISNLMERHMDQVALTPSERKMITDEMYRLSLRVSGRLCILNWKGVVLEDSARRSGEDLGHRPEVKSALQGRSEQVIRGLERGASEDVEKVTEPTMFVAVPMRAKGKVTGAVYASRSLTDLQLLLLNLRELLYQVALGSLCFALVLSLAMAQWLAAPLTRLTRAAQRLGEGHLEERLVVKSRDELGRLAGSFNEMAGNLKRHRDSLLQFVSDASHELKTPLASLRSLSDALEGGALAQPETAQKFLTYIQTDLDRMEKLVGDLLELHKLDQAVLRINCVELELRPLIAEVSERYAVTIEGASPRVLADPERLRQVLLNLLENARRAVGEVSEPRIVIRLGIDGFSVSDNGVGLAPETLERVFDRFYRVDGSRSRDEGGTGLGLSITRGLVEAMGGTIRAASGGLGEGATFEVLLAREGHPVVGVAPSSIGIAHA